MLLNLRNNSIDLRIIIWQRAGEGELCKCENKVWIVNNVASDAFFCQIILVNPQDSMNVGEASCLKFNPEEIGLNGCRRMMKC